MKAEKALFNDAFPCNSYPFLRRIEELLRENKTNNLSSLKGKELDKAKACLFILLSQAYGQLFKIDSVEEFERLNRVLKLKEKNQMGEESLFNEENVIYQYTQDEAIEDGILVVVGSCGNQRIIFTANLFSDCTCKDEDGKNKVDIEKLRRTIEKGLSLLREPDKEDTNYMRLRVIEKNKIWVIWNTEGFTFMKPEDVRHVGVD